MTTVTVTVTVTVTGSRPTASALRQGIPRAG
jgi:hypothetical protein